MEAVRILVEGTRLLLITICQISRLVRTNKFHHTASEVRQEGDIKKHPFVRSLHPIGNNCIHGGWEVVRLESQDRDDGDG